MPRSSALSLQRLPEFVSKTLLIALYYCSEKGSTSIAAVKAPAVAVAAAAAAATAAAATVAAFCGRSENKRCPS